MATLVISGAADYATAPTSQDARKYNKFESDIEAIKQEVLSYRLNATDSTRYLICTQLYNDLTAIEARFSDIADGATAHTGTITFADWP